MSPSPQRIGITLGDPAGIGPEIVVRALAGMDEGTRGRFTVFGDEFIVREWLTRLEQPRCQISTVDTGALNPHQLSPGRPNDATAIAQLRYLEAAVQAAREGVIGAIATAPISKVAVQSVGFAFPGHTEYLADAFGVDQVAMMFAGPKLNVVLATVHIGLMELRERLRSEDIVSVGRLGTDALLRDFACPVPRVGVLGLNPHAGEAGTFGDEEARVIEPAIAALRAHYGERARFEGPLVPDAAFRQPFDLFIAMYHDQGLIPVKLIDFDESVNTTLGLPIVRTSPDHGVAYDIAGRGVARDTSMRAAMELAARLLDGRAS